MDTGTLISVRDMVDGGVPLSAAIKAHLARNGMTLGKWCRTVGHNRTSMSKLLHGDGVVYSELRDAMCRSFGVDREWLDSQLG